VRRYLPAVLTVASMAITTPALCQGLDTEVGLQPFAGETWCTWPTPKWVTRQDWGDFNATTGAHCANFGGAWVVTPSDPFTNAANGAISTPPGNNFGTGGAGYDMNINGVTMWMRVRPPTATGAHRRGFWEINWAGDSPFFFILIEYGEGPTYSYLDLMFAGLGSDEYVRLSPYDPAAHAWWRVRHNATTGALALDTAPFCGAWTERLSGTLNSRIPPVAMSLVHDLFTITPGDTVTGATPGWFGQIFAGSQSAAKPPACDDLDTELGEQDAFGSPCLSLNTACGDSASGSGVWANWATGVSSAWLVTDNTDVTVSGASANFGSALTVAPNAGRAGSASHVMRTVGTFDFLGRGVAVRVKPMTGTTPTARLSLDPAAGSPGGAAVASLELTTAGNLVATISGPASASDTVAYSATAHAWWRIVHDEDTGVVSVQAAPFCGEWVTLASATVGATVRSHRLTLAQGLGAELGGESAGFFGAIYGE